MLVFKSVVHKKKFNKPQTSKFSYSSALTWKYLVTLTFHFPNTPMPSSAKHATFESSTGNSTLPFLYQPLVAFFFFAGGFFFAASAFL